MNYTVEQIRFEAIRNAMYHAARRRFLDRSNRFFSFVVVIAGAYAFADIAGQFATSAGHGGAASAAAWGAFVATIAATLQLVFDLGSASRTHEFLQRRFYELSAELDEAENPDEQTLRRWRATLSRLYADEPPPMRALVALTTNATVDYLGYGAKERVKVTPWQALWSQLWAFSGTDFPYAGTKTPA